LILISKEVVDRWEENAACFHPSVDEDLFFSPVHEERCLARHICWTHCAVRDECYQHYTPGGSQTAGGFTYRQNGKPMKIQPMPPSTCHLCKVLS
jgi:hypothetical protein